jgi:uncharacterized protein (DUF2062 family)
VAAQLARLAGLNRAVHLPTYNRLIAQEALRLQAEAPPEAAAGGVAAGVAAGGAARGTV